MQTYIGVKMIEAVPGIKNGEEGYNVIYPDGYASWSPKDAFEAAYMPINTKDTLCQADIDFLVAEAKSSTADPKTTIVRAELLTGFSLFETSACVDEANYDEVKGANMAMLKINSKVWFAMGFVLQWARYGLKNTPKHVRQPEGEQDGNTK